MSKLKSSILILASPGYASLEAVNVPDSTLSFSNPHYLGPDVKTLLEMTDEANHAKFAQALMSPTTEERTVREVEMVEKVTPRSAFISHQPPRPPVEMREGGGRRNRSVSAGRLDIRDNRVTPEKTEESETSERSDLAELMLLMYVIGGREVGQVTVFRRPISMWKLDLTRL